MELKTWVKVAVLAGGVPPELPLDPPLDPLLDPPLEPAPASAFAEPPELASGDPASVAAPGPPVDAPELERVAAEPPPESTSCAAFEPPPEFEPDELALWPEPEPIVSASSPGAVPPPEAPLHPASVIDATSARGATKISPRRTIPSEKTSPCITHVSAHAHAR